MAKGKTFPKDAGVIGVGKNGELNVVTSETPRFSLDQIKISDPTSPTPDELPDETPQETD